MTIDPKIHHGLEAKRAAVTAARKTYENAKKRLEALEAELRGWEEVARVMAAGDSTQPESPTPVRRRLSDEWRAVIGEMAEKYPKEFSLAEIGALCSKHQINVSGDTIRGQMHHHADETKFVARTAPGRFRATERGATAAGVTLGEPAANVDDEIPF